MTLRAIPAPWSRTVELLQALQPKILHRDGSGPNYSRVTPLIPRSHHMTHNYFRARDDRTHRI
jgi:hypothetical protein